MNTPPENRQSTARIDGKDHFTFSSSAIGDLAARVVVVHVSRRGPVCSEQIEELKMLVQATGAEVCGVISGVRVSPHPATFLGKGKTAEIANRVREVDADLVVFDQSLTPVQERNLERELACRVLDRIGLILDIFAIRARTHEGKLQVELAQLRHLSTRLVRGWTHLERQKGGIGLRGPGETQLETDRRLIGRRIKTLHGRLQKVSGQRALRRRARDRVPVPTVSMVGYTNAGKSTLFNQITGAGVYVANQLFATLDPTMRRTNLNGFGTAIFSDTVGFIRDLPHGLIRAFHSTLEEVAEAALLLLVVDVSDANHRETIEQISKVLQEINAADVPRITVYNKIDLIGGEPGIDRSSDGRLKSVRLSAHTGAGLELLNTAIADYLSRAHIRRIFNLPPGAGRIRALLYEKADVIDETIGERGGWSMEVEMAESLLSWLIKQPDFAAEFSVEEPDPLH